MEVLAGKHRHRDDEGVGNDRHQLGWKVDRDRRWNSLPRRLAALLVISCASPLGAHLASAQELPREGPFTVNFTAIGIDRKPPVAIADDRNMGLTSTIMTAANASGQGLMHNLAGRCVGWYIVDRTSASYEQHGHCNYIDGDGDIVYEKYDFDFQALRPVRIGAGKWIGGTGKYAGLTGVFEIRVRLLKPAQDGQLQAIGTKQGQYRLPAPAAAQ